MKSRAAEMVEEFHRTFGHAVRDKAEALVPEFPLRYELIAEELAEYLKAGYEGDTVGVADALADLLYVVYGAALCHGIPVDDVLEEVHRSNMTKLGPDGKPVIRGDGKFLKGPNYEPPDIEKVLANATS